MKVGISTASLFLDLNTEDATEFLAKNNVGVCEIFLTARSEYEKSFAEELVKRKGNMLVNSVHALTTQFEPQLYSKNSRAYEDAFNTLTTVLETAKIIGAKNYTFHGYARIKKTPIKIDYDTCGDFTNKIAEKCAEYGVNLSYETVHWCYYNYIGFFREMKKRCPILKGTLDIKQARQSDIFYGDFITEMGKDISTVHITDIGSDGKMCLPGFGEFNFDEMFSRLKDVGFNGTVLTEAYRNDFCNREELFTSLQIIKEKASKYFEIE